MNNSKSIVALIDSRPSLSLPNLTKSIGLCSPQLQTLNDPSTGEKRQYMIFPDSIGSKPHQHQPKTPNHIFEVQSIPASRSKNTSYFVKSTVISNGNLHLISRIDPLYNLLSYLTPSTIEEVDENNTKVQKWQPWSQIIETFALPPSLINAINMDKDLIRIMDIDDSLGDDLVLYRLSTVKVLEWLLQKLLRVEKILEMQMMKRKERNNYGCQDTKNSNGLSQKDGGAFSSSFRLSKRDKSESKEHSNDINLKEQNYTAQSGTSSITTEEKNYISRSAMQILSEYLPEFWYMKLLEKKSMSVKDLFPQNKRQHSQSPTKEESKNDIEISTEKVSNQGSMTASPLKEQTIGENNKIVVTPSTVSTYVSKHESKIHSTLSESDKLLQYTMGVECVGSSSNTTNSTGVSGMKTNESKPKSFGLKKLEKVNTKGMQSLSSFFSARPTSTFGTNKKQKTK